MSDTQILELLRKVYRVVERDDFPVNVSSDFIAKIDACKTLIKADRVLQKWSERQCNGIYRYDSALRRSVPSWTDSDELALARARERETKRINSALLALFGPAVDQLSVEIGGDPRGAAIKVYLSGRSDPLFWV